MVKKLDDEIRKSIKDSVLCWLATASPDGQPNVSPKEAFTCYKDRYIIIANIASPNTVRNICLNERVCVSFIDIFVQKGFQIKGKAEIVHEGASGYYEMALLLNKITEGKFPFHSVTLINIEQTKAIIAPKYFLYPETTEEQQIESAMISYGLKQE